MVKPLGFLALVLVAACSTAAMNSKPYDHSDVVSRNYQAAFADTLRSVKACLNGDKTWIIESELYPDLGYGEISVVGSAINFVFVDIKISKTESGGLLEAKFGGPNKSGNDGVFDWITYWSKGGRACGTLSQMTPPRI